MLVEITLGLMIMMTMLSIILGNVFIPQTVQLAIDNEAFVDGLSNTFEVLTTDVLFQIDTTTLVGAIGVIGITFITVATLTGISVLGTGLNPQSARIIILATVFTGVWVMLSLLSYPLIISIEIFGGLIYVALTIGFVIGVIQSISGGSA